MRIFEVIESSSNSSVSSLAWYRNLYEPLIDMGHEVILFPAEEGRRAMQKQDVEIKARFSQNLLDKFHQEHSRKPLNLFFSYLMDGMVDVGVIDEVRKTGVPTCNFSCNNTHQFDLVHDISLHFDFNLHSEKEAARKFYDIGANPIWFPMAANPRYYHPYETVKKIDVSFVGQCYARRPYYIWFLLENGIDVHVFGPGWKQKNDQLFLRQIIRTIRRLNLLIKLLLVSSSGKRYQFAAQLMDMDLRNHLSRKYKSHFHGIISDEQMVKNYSESKISLGFLEVYDGHNPALKVQQHIHLREFEAPMSGAFYLTGYTKELAEFYEPDKEIVIYHSEHEMLEKIRYYLTHPDQAEKIRQAGYIRARRDHTYQRRFETLFQNLNLEL